MIIERFKDIFDNMHDYSFHILGCGAIGSSVATQLARSGAEKFVLYDLDMVETANIGVSQYGHSFIGQYKTTALGIILEDINPECEIMEMTGLFETFMYYNEDDIIILGFDSMKSRLEAMETCLSYKGFNPKLLIDGRMGAEHYQQYTLIKPTLKRY